MSSAGYLLAKCLGLALQMLGNQNLLGRRSKTVLVKGKKYSVTLIGRQPHSIITQLALIGICGLDISEILHGGDHVCVGPSVVTCQITEEDRNCILAGLSYIL